MSTLAMSKKKEGMCVYIQYTYVHTALAYSLRSDLMLAFTERNGSTDSGSIREDCHAVHIQEVGDFWRDLSRSKRIFLCGTILPSLYSLMEL
jgi:hypothetical protein